MSALSKILRNAEDAHGGKYLTFWCPGCSTAHGAHGVHQVKVVGPGSWGWNGNVDKPTFTPSVLVTYGMFTPPVTPENFEQFKIAPWEQTKVNHICHSFVTDGRIQFLTDCTHALAGQTVDLPEWPRRE